MYLEKGTCNADTNSIPMLKSISQGFNDMLPSPLIITSRADRVYMVLVILKRTYLSTLTHHLGMFELYIGGSTWLLQLVCRRREWGFQQDLMRYQVKKVHKHIYSYNKHTWWPKWHILCIISFGPIWVLRSMGCGGARIRGYKKAKNVLMMSIYNIPQVSCCDDSASSIQYITDLGQRKY